ncbi:hypothetical protein [Nocardioides sp.]|uniref:hypothetical protein n=1 Tax=Nocardioides sp. TaxID=35761 RepID=UPI0035165DD4
MSRLLRTDVAWALLPLLVASALVLQNGGWPWRGDWNWTIDTIAGSTVLTGPLVGGLAAWMVVRAAALRPLTDTTPRRAWVVVRQAGLAAGLGLVAYALTALVAVAITLAVPHGGDAGWAALVIGPLVLAACAMTGAALALHLPHPLTALAVPVGLFLLGDLAPRPGPELLRHGPVTGSLAGLRFDLAVIAWHSLALAGLTALLTLAALPSRDTSPLPRARAALLVAGLLTGGTGTILTMSSPPERFVITAERPDVCAGTPVQVCLPAAQQRQLDRILPGVQQVAARLTAAGAALPDRFEAALPGYRPPPEVGLLARGISDDLPTDPSALAALLMRPSPCPDYFDPTARPGDEYAFATELLIAVAVATEPDAVITGPERAWLQQTDPAERRSWVARTYSALRACDLEAVRLPDSLRAGLPE